MQKITLGSQLVVVIVTAVSASTQLVVVVVTAVSASVHTLNFACKNVVPKLSCDRSLFVPTTIPIYHLSIYLVSLLGTMFVSDSQ